MRIFIFGLLFGIIGFVGGYLFFAKVNGHYVPIENIFFPSGDLGKRLGQILNTPLFADIPAIRQNILIFGGVGLTIGLLIGFFTKGSKR